MQLQLPGRTIHFPRRPLIMGIVNVNDDSFCGDGTLDITKAIEQAAFKVRSGADLIDVGAESARTNRQAISVAEEAQRLQEFLGRWEEVIDGAEPRDETQIWPPVLSVNTWRNQVVRDVLKSPTVEIINDMGGLPEDLNAKSCAAYGAALVIMHTIAPPKIPQTRQSWSDVMTELLRFFESKILTASNAGMNVRSIILDPGIDFAKQRDDNLTIFSRLASLHPFELPLLMPISRKTVIGDVLALPNPLDRDAGTIACLTASVLRGAQIVRVHDVAATRQAIRTLEAVIIQPTR